jgi:hypothetical protein
MSRRDQEIVSGKRKSSRRGLLKSTLLVLSAGAIIQPTGAVLAATVQTPPKTSSTPKKATTAVKVKNKGYLKQATLPKPTPTPTPNPNSHPAGKRKG